MARPPQAVPPTPFAPAEDEEFVVSEQLRRRRDELGRKMVNTYVLGDIIGKGQHGTVRKAIDKSANHDSRLVAIKSVKRTNQRAEKIHLLRKQRVANFPRDPEHVPLTARISSTENKIRKEIAIMKKCKNAHIVRLLEVIDDRTKEKIYMVMEYMGGGEVKWRDGRDKPILTVDQTRRIIRDVVLGLEYLHYNGIIHRDIKPANLLWSTDRQRVKIADFGVSHFSYAQSLGVAASSARQRSKRRKGKNDAAELLDPADRVLLDEEDLNRFAGTPSFLAPEVVDGLVEDTTPLRPPKRKLGKGVDIWALGVTLYCLLFGRPPWIEPGNEYRTYYLIMCTEWPIHSVMGFDRLSTGGRPHSQPPTRTRAGKEVALPEGVLVMRLLDSLLQKDSDRRMHLDDVKRYPWFTRDIPNIDIWLTATAPQKHAKLYVTDEESQASLSPLRFVWDRATTLTKNSVAKIRSIPSRASISNSRHPSGHKLSEPSTTPPQHQHLPQPQSQPTNVERQRSLKRLLTPLHTPTPNIPIPGTSSKGKGKDTRPPHLRQDSSPEHLRGIRDRRPSIDTPGTPRATSRRGSDAMTSEGPPTPSPAGSMGSGSGAMTPGGTGIYGHSSSSRARNSIASLFALFLPAKFTYASTGSGGASVTSGGPSRLNSAMHSPTEPLSPPLSVSPPRKHLPRIGSTSAVWPRLMAEDGPPKISHVGRTRTSVMPPRPNNGLPRRGLSYGVGGGQLSAEMRASSFGEPADYDRIHGLDHDHEHDHEHDHARGDGDVQDAYMYRRAPDVTSVHSGPDLDDEVLFFGAGGVAEAPSSFPPSNPHSQPHSQSHSQSHSQAHTPTTPVSPGVTPGIGSGLGSGLSSALAMSELVAALPPATAVPPAMMPSLAEGQSSVGLAVQADPAMQETSAFLSRVGSGGGRPHASSPLAGSAYASSEEESCVDIGGGGRQNGCAPGIASVSGVSGTSGAGTSNGNHHGSGTGSGNGSQDEWSDSDDDTSDREGDATMETDDGLGGVAYDSRQHSRDDVVDEYGSYVDTEPSHDQHSSETDLDHDHNPDLDTEEDDIDIFGQELARHQQQHRAAPVVGSPGSHIYDDEDHERDVFVDDDESEETGPVEIKRKERRPSAAVSGAGSPNFR